MKCSPHPPTHKGRMSERQLEKAIVQLAELRQWWVHTIADSRSLRSHTGGGFPDLALVRGPRLVFAELKSAKGRVRETQYEWLTKLQGAGAECYLWRPADWTNGAIEAILR